MHLKTKFTEFESKYTSKTFLFEFSETQIILTSNRVVFRSISNIYMMEHFCIIVRGFQISLFSIKITWCLFKKIVYLKPRTNLIGILVLKSIFPTQFLTNHYKKISKNRETRNKKMFKLSSLHIPSRYFFVQV